MVPQEGDGYRKTFSLRPTDAVEAFWMILVGVAGSAFFVGLALRIATSHSFHGPLQNDHFPSVSLAVLAVGLVVIGTGCLIVAQLLERPLDGASQGALSASWQRRLFVWIGMGEIPLFLGVAVIAVTGRFWLYLIGSIFMLTSLLRVAPTSRRLARDQDHLDNSGSPLSLRDALDAGMRRRKP